jgi:hypothetical protein
LNESASTPDCRPAQQQAVQQQSNVQNQTHVATLTGTIRQVNPVFLLIRVSILIYPSVALIVRKQQGLQSAQNVATSV